jgi:hypothetical protein
MIDDLEDILRGSGIPTPALGCGSAAIPTMLGALRPDFARFTRELLAGQAPARAARRAWPQDTEREAETSARDALARPEIRDILAAYEREAACPDCGERRCHAEAFGRFFWEACEPCERRSLRERMKAWRDRVARDWSAKMAQQVGATHWGQPVELIAPLKRLLSSLSDEAAPVWAAYLWGKAGTGKTQQAAEALRGALAARLGKLSPQDMERFGDATPPLPAYVFASEAALLRALRPGGDGVFERYTGAALLVLDDAGESKATDWAYEILKSLIDERYKTRRPTIFTSNRSLPDLRAAGLYDERITSRIFEMCGGLGAHAAGTLTIHECKINYRMPRGEEGGLW